MKEAGKSYEQKLAYIDNPGQNTWNKVKKYSKIGKENFDICFCINFNCYYQLFISGRETGH